MKRDAIYTVESITQLHEIVGFEKPKHPLVSVIDFSKIDVGDNARDGSIVCDFYSINFKKHCSFIYGRQTFDHDEGTLHCSAPGQVITYNREQEKNSTEGIGLFFHPELIRKSNLGKKISEYTFFSYSSNEALHLSDHEKKALLALFEQIGIECSTNIDSFTQDLLVSNIELLLNYCNRFYNRQFLTRTNQSKDIIIEFEKYLLEYFNAGKLEIEGIPSVKKCAESLNLSPNYLGDLLKKETGKSAQEHIHNHLLEKSKTLLSSNRSIKEIAYTLGFEHPQSFSKLFKKKMGVTPSEYKVGVN